MQWGLIVLAFAAGMVLPVQVGLNNRLRGYFESPMQATLVSFAIGTLGTLLYCLGLRLRWPSPATLAQVPWWAWFGGFMGGFYVWSTIVVGPRIGAAATLALVVAGQMMASLVLDHVGAFDLPQSPISLWRVVGMLLVVAGVTIVAVTK